MARFERYFECHCRPGDPSCPHEPEDPDFACPECYRALDETDYVCPGCGWESYVCRECGNHDADAVRCIAEDLSVTFVCQDCVSHTLRVVCAWCRAVLGEKRSEVARPGGAVSHGICAACKVRVEAEMVAVQVEQLAAG